MLTDSIVPDYSYMTEERLADFWENTRGTRTYIYKYNQSEFDEYYSYLEKDGWEIYDYNSNDASLVITYHMLKDSYLISFDCKFYISPKYGLYCESQKTLRFIAWRGFGGIVEGKYRIAL